MNDKAPTARELAAGLGHRKLGRIQVGPPEERTYKGVLFASVQEMNDYKQLEPLLDRGIFKSLRRQVIYKLHGVTAGGCKIVLTSYRADFIAEEQDGRTTVYDSKGHQTEMYKLKRRWMEIEYGVRIVEL